MTFDRFDFYKDSKDVFILPTIRVSTQMELIMMRYLRIKIYYRLTNGVSR